MHSRQRVVHLLATRVVAAKGVGPDKVIRVLHAQPMRAVVGVGYHVLAAQSFASAHAVCGHVSLELYILEVIWALVAVLVLHPRDGAVAGLRHLLDAAGGAYHLRLLGVKLLRHAVVADNLLALCNRFHQCVVAPVLDVHSEALQQLIGVALQRDVAQHEECVAVVRVGDVCARLLRPMHVVEPVLQLPSLQAAVLKVGVSVMLNSKSIFRQFVSCQSHDHNVELMPSTASVSDYVFIDCRNVVNYPIELARNKIALFCDFLQIGIRYFDWLYFRVKLFPRFQFV